MSIVEINPEPVLSAYTPHVFANSSSNILPQIIDKLSSDNKA